MQTGVLFLSGVYWYNERTKTGKILVKPKTNEGLFKEIPGEQLHRK